jgi:hypothetical protein
LSEVLLSHVLKMTCTNLIDLSEHYRNARFELTKMVLLAANRAQTSRLPLLWITHATLHFLKRDACVSKLRPQSGL